jgi:hypothetical protein
MARSGGANSVRTNQEFDEWIRTHANGTQIEVRLDPADSQNAELVDMNGLPNLRYSKINVTEIYVVGILFAVAQFALRRMAKAR